MKRLYYKTNYKPYLTLLLVLVLVFVSCKYLYVFVKKSNISFSVKKVAADKLTPKSKTNTKNTSDFTYKSIIPHEKAPITDNSLSVLEIISIINKQSEDLLNLLQSESLSTKKDNVFTTYYCNLDYYASVISQKLNNGDNDGIKFNSDPKNFAIISPKLSNISVYYNEEWGDIVVEINGISINNTYSKYLGESWKQFLTLQKSKYESIHKNSFWLDNDKRPTLSTLFDWLIAEEKFIQDYPNFDTNLLEQIRPIGTVDTIFRRTCGKGIPTSKTKSEYENYLKKADKNNKSYKYIKQAYTILEKNNWNPDSHEFEKFIRNNNFGGWGS